MLRELHHARDLNLLMLIQIKATSLLMNLVLLSNRVTLCLQVSPSSKPTVIINALAPTQRIQATQICLSTTSTFSNLLINNRHKTSSIIITSKPQLTSLRKKRISIISKTVSTSISLLLMVKTTLNQVVNKSWHQVKRWVTWPQMAARWIPFNSKTLICISKWQTQQQTNQLPASIWRTSHLLCRCSSFNITSRAHSTILRTIMWVIAQGQIILESSKAIKRKTSLATS